MLSRRTRHGLSAVATALTAMAAPASAQRVDRIVAFGDSYADDGNAFQFGYANPQALAIYPTGRFSGGSNYIDTLSTILHAPVENFVIGGALGGTDNGLLCFEAAYGAPLCGKGLRYEVDRLLAGGGGAAFPTVTPSFDAGDLVAISIGGNDSRLYQQAGGPLALAAPSGTAAAATTAVQLDRLVAAGAPTINVLAGDTGQLPEILTDPSGAAIRTAYSDAFNERIQASLAGYAANGTIVHYLDLVTLGNRIKGDYAAYGLTSLACPAPTPSAPGCLVDSSAYLFYVDGLHLTSAGFAIVARYVAAQLEAPLTLQATSDLALDTAHQWGRTLTSRLDLSAPRDGDQPEGVHAYLVGDTLTRSMSRRQRADAYRATTKGVTAGVDFGFGSGIAGLAVNYSRPHLGLTNDAAETKGESWQAGGYAGFGLAGAFAQAYLGYGRDRHDIKRQGVIDALYAHPHGSHIVGGAKAGYLMPLGPIRLGPVAALDYAKAKVDAYGESGDAALALNVDQVRYHSLRGSAGVELRGDFADGGVSLRPYASIVAEKDFAGDERALRFAQTDAPLIVNRWQTEGGSKKVYARFTTGASAAVFGNVALDISLSGTAGQPNGNETSAHLGARLGF